MSLDNRELNRVKETLQILMDSNAILENDHFVYVSGHHGSGWIDKDAIYPDTKRLMKLGKLLVEAVTKVKAELICGPASGGLVVAQWTAYNLGALSVFTEHDPSWQSSQKVPHIEGLRVHFVLWRGYDRLVSEGRVLVVDDIVNTGFSVKSTAKVVSEDGGYVVAIASIVNRGNGNALELGVKKFIYLLEYKIPSWLPSGCKLCHEGVPINTRYAHGLEYLQAKEK